MTTAEKKARVMIEGLSTKKIIQQFLLTTNMPINNEVATIRSWLMDELEKRNSTGFWAWIEEDGEDETIGAYILHYDF